MNSRLFFSLRHPVTIERTTSLVCIPDRDTAECERTRLRAQHGPDLLRADIRKDRPLSRHSQATADGRSGPSRTYTLRYTIRETETRTLF